MFLFTPVSWCRRLARWLACEWFQLALWLAFGMRFTTGVRSAFRTGATDRGGERQAVRPHRCQRSAGRHQHSHSTASKPTPA